MLFVPCDPLLQALFPTLPSQIRGGREAKASPLVSEVSSQC